MKLKIIKFESTGCGPCKLIDRSLSVVTKDIPNLTIEHVDVNDNESLTKGYGIRRVPTLVFLNEDGDEVGRTSGYLTPEQITKEINEIWKN